MWEGEHLEWKDQTVMGRKESDGDGAAKIKGHLEEL